MICLYCFFFYPSHFAFLDKFLESTTFSTKFKSGKRIKRHQTLVHGIPGGFQKKKSSKTEKDKTKKEKKKKKRDSIEESGGGDEGISLPYNFEKKVHVDTDFQWSGQSPDKVFSLAEKLGEG